MERAHVGKGGCGDNAGRRDFSRLATRSGLCPRIGMGAGMAPGGGVACRAASAQHDNSDQRGGHPHEDSRHGKKCPLISAIFGINDACRYPVTAGMTGSLGDRVFPRATPILAHVDTTVTRAEDVSTDWGLESLAALGQTTLWTLTGPSRQSRLPFLCDADGAASPESALRGRRCDDGRAWRPAS